MKRKKTLDDSIKRSKQVVDATITNLFLRDLKDYGIDAKVFSKEGIRKINQSLEHLDLGKREEKELKQKTEARVARYQRFRDLPVEDRSEIAKIVREKGISVEEAYALKEKAV